MKKIMIILTACTMLLCGCAESNKISGGSSDFSDLPYPQSGIVWDQLWDEFDEIYTDPEVYPFSGTVNVSFYDDDNLIKFFLLTEEKITKKEAAEYATEVIRGLGELLAEQNPDYSEPTESSYGSFLDGYEIYVMVAEDDTKSSRATWILEDTIALGEYRAVNGEE